MEWDEFRTRLLETGSYETPASNRALFPRFVERRLFRLRMARVYWHAWRRSKDPEAYVSRLWAPNGFEVVRAVERTGGRVAVEGFDRLRGAPMPAVFVANHVSALETYLVAPLLLPFTTYTYVLKKSLVRYPVLGRVVRALDPVPVGRKSAMDDLRDVLQHGTETLRRGRSVVVFPQGTRHRLFDPATFNSIGAKLARRAGVPVVPLCLATDFLRIGEWQRDLFSTVHPESTVRAACGGPVPPDVPQAEVQRRCLDFISSTLARWEELDGRPMLDPAALLPPPAAPGRS
ncbi:MAG: 1-acyl-sn-glycerol-3-phosphate acyltransferase [Kiritimatiellae bacterium]|nr:1-acyl-sn-glycerol-3-phosphate acyltransferase [Kiritimatiellia bacterium]